MTLTETDRLIRSLREALKDPSGAAAASAAASARQYAENCGAVNRRLEQCAAMLDQGDDQQAVQLAETDPPVLDLLTLLSFDKAHDWREFCQTHHLPIANPFDARIVHRLNAVYAKGISVNHPLYRDYRAQVMKNRLPEAAATLRSIVRLNPSDDNAKRELDRLDEKLLGQDLEKLSKLVAANDEQGAVALVDRLEEQHFTGGLKPQGAVWERGLAVRREQLKRQALAEARATLSQIGSLQTAGKWQAAAPMLRHIKSLQAEHGFAFKDEEARSAGEFQTWVAWNQHEFSQQQAFQQALAELDHLLEYGEQRHASAGVSGLPGLRAELAALVAKWRQVEGFERPLPDGLEPRYRKRAGLTRLEVDRLQKLRANFWIAGSAAAAIACAVGIYLFVQHQKSNDLAGHLQRLTASRQVGATEKLLSDARASEPKLFEHADVKAAAAAAETYVQSEHARQKEFEDIMAALTALAAEQPAAFASRPPEAVQAMFTDAQRRKTALPAEFQVGAEAPMAAFRNRWEAFIIRESTTLNEHFASALENLEKRAGEELSYRRTPEELRQSITRLAAELQPLTAQAQHPPVPALAVRDDLATRLAGVAATLGAFTAELAKFDAALTGMRNAGTLDAYMEALRAGQDSELRNSRELSAAKQLVALHLSADGLLAATLTPGDMEGWEFIKANPAAGFVPTSTVLDPERRIYDQLLVDSNIRNVYVYQFNNPSSGNKITAVYSRGLLDGGTINGGKFNPKGTFYQPDRFTTVLNFEDSSLDGTVTGEQAAPDSQAFLELKFRDLIDSSADRFASGQGAPLHEFLDRLTRNRKASPLFKAFVFARVYQITQVGRRAGFWGLPFTPALQKHAAELARTGAPASGYWMVPEEIEQKSRTFKQFFDAAARVSYAQQARVLQAAIREIMAGGITFRGFADRAGQPQLAGHESETGLPQPDLWGWSARVGKPVKLFTWSAKDGKYRSANEPAPLTPLVAPEHDPKDVLRATCKRFGLTEEDIKNSITPFLPPLFAE